MIDLNFKKWVEQDETNSGIAPELQDPNLASAAKQAKNAAQMALKNKKNPIQAAQQAVLQSNVPVNKLGSIMPKDQDQKNAVN